MHVCFGHFCGECCSAYHGIIACVQGVVYPLARLAQAEDATAMALGNGNPSCPYQQQPGSSVPPLKRQSRTSDTSDRSAAAGRLSDSAAVQPNAVAEAAVSEHDTAEAVLQQCWETNEEGSTRPVAADDVAVDARELEGSHPADILRHVQQTMVHLTMLLSSRNLWMRPAVLEAPAQDPQYLEAIHKASHAPADHDG